MTDYKKKLEELILTVIRENGSDLHLGAGRVPAIRVSGELIFLVKQEYQDMHINRFTFWWYSEQLL